jgi:hypothetical protein
MYAGPGKTRRITIILSSLCLLLFVVHVFLLLRIRPIGGVLCVSFFLHCLNPANVWREHAEQFARFERLRFNVIIIHPIMTLRFGMYTSFKRLICRGNSLCVSDHFSYAASFASSCSSRVQLNCPGNVHLQLQHFNSFQNQRLPPTLPDPLDTTNTSS